MAASDAPRCGVVGPERTNIGLGPFLIRELEAAGACVAAVAGRDRARAERAAQRIAGRYGHPVAAAASTEAMLAESRLDAVVIAAPIPAHLPALRAALAADVAVLCEKPLVAPDEHALVPALVDGFAERRLPLVENCIWPNVLPPLAALVPGLLDPPIETYAMRLSPVGRGLHMLVDSLSHFLSVIQRLVAVDPTTRLQAVEIRDDGPEGERLELSIELESPFPPLRAELYLVRCATQPRPAWLEINGVRAERRIRPADYGISFSSDGRSVDVEDPLTVQVRSFVQSLQEPDLDRARAEAAAIRERARLYRSIFAAWSR